MDRTQIIAALALSAIAVQPALAAVGSNSLTQNGLTRNAVGSNGWLNGAVVSGQRVIGIELPTDTRQAD